MAEPIGSPVVVGSDRGARRTSPTRALAGFLTLALVIGLLFFSATPASAAPVFKLPFRCGETWHASTYTVYNGYRHGHAMDFNAWPDDGKPVLASAAGTVRMGSAAWGEVLIDHGGGWTTQYLHMKSRMANLNGRHVAAGTQIGLVSAVAPPGGADGPHLHYEQRLNGVEQPVTIDGRRITAGYAYSPADPSYMSTNCGSAPPPAPANPVLHNGGLEGGLPPWTRPYIPSGSTVNITTYTNSGRQRSGKVYLESNTSKPGGSVGQDMSGDPVKGKHYDFTVWARTSGGTAVVQPTLWALGGTQESASTSYTIGTTWTPIRVVLSPTRNGHTSLRAELYMNTTGVNYRFDDASLKVTSGRPSFSQNPIGAFDSVSSPAPARVRVRGWAFDPNAPTAPTNIHIYVSGRAGTAGAEGKSIGNATIERSGVAGAYSWAGAGHGFDVILSTAKRGNQEVCAYSINRGAGSNELLGCRTVTIADPPPPVTTPTAPTSVTVTPASNNRGLVVRWAPPSSTGGSAITAYDAVATGGHFCRTDGSGRSCTISGLTRGKTYRVTVVASNRVGAGSISSVKTVALTDTVAVTTGYTASDHAMLERAARRMDKTPEQLTEEAAALIAYLVAISDLSDKRPIRPVPYTTGPHEVTVNWKPDQIGGVDSIGRFFSLDRAQAQRVSVNVFVYLAMLEGA